MRLVSACASAEMISTPITIPTPRQATKNAPRVVLHEVVVMGATQLHNNSSGGLEYNLEVRATNGTWSLRRTFDQFDMLHEQLVRSYLIPPLPMRPRIFNDDVTLTPGANNPVRVACAQMGAWLVSIWKNERVRTSNELVTFFSADGDIHDLLNMDTLSMSVSMLSDGLPGMSMDETTTAAAATSAATITNTGTTMSGDQNNSQMNNAAMMDTTPIAYKPTNNNNNINVNTAMTEVNDDVIFPDDDDDEEENNDNEDEDMISPEATKVTSASAPVSLKDFMLLKVIGKGSFGKVMLVRKIDNQQIYAMKVLEKDNVVKRNQVEHTKTERNVLEYVRHPFIVTLRYAFQTKRKLYFVLDYCPGGELFFHLGKAGRFSEQRVRFYAAQIVLALQYLHEKGVVYRDLKPENVLLDAAGNIALTDFGLSKEGIMDNASAHSFCGTPEYLAPEILTRAGHGRAADWWSLGALMYEMLSGMPPFYSRDRNRLFKKILRAQLRMPQYFTADTVSFLEALLDRDPTRRLGSGVDDAEEVKRHAFFRGVSWDDVYNKRLQTPYVPLVRNLLDTNNFDAEFTSMDLDKDSASSVSRSSLYASSLSRGRFQGFTYVNDDPLDGVQQQQQQHNLAVPPS